jgi:hypothetical protein
MGSRLPLFALAVLCLAIGRIWAADSPDPTEELPPPTVHRVLLDAEALSAKIDQLIAAEWAAKGATPAPLADDAEYFRRLSLDITGRTPSITLLKDFMDDPRPDKRRLWVDILMQRTIKDASNNLYVNHFATYWRTLFFSQTTNQQAQLIGAQLEPWLKKHVKENTPYNQIVKELLTTPQGNIFYQANENKPENIASNTSRLFLGVKLECAQCHDDRSGGHWTRKQFWEYAAFFTGINRGGAKAEIKIPDKNQVVQARFLDGAQPTIKPGSAPQLTLADWMTSANNPFFARAAVNRMWHYFMGTGLVDPVDFMAIDDNPPSHPELLDELAFQFAAHNFDLKYLMRAITGSRAYQLTSRQTHESQENPRLFARMAVRGMTAEQIFDSVLEATGADAPPPGNMNRFNAFGFPNSPRDEFIARFTNIADKRTETHTSILQALTLMNGKTLDDLLKNSKALATVQANDQSPLTRNIEELYLVTVSRKPTPEEMERMVKYVATRDRKAALADIFWALLNSAEFILNH